MLINRDREKLLHAVAFFAENVDKCGKIKLFKLLYFLDFEHYKLTGRSVTGMDYFAWQMGPVPVELYDEISSPQPDMAEMLSFKEIPVYHGKNTMLKVETKKDFDSSYFTKRELKIMHWLVDSYKKELADDMIEATHLENLPWHQIYNVENKKRELIPYELAFRKQEYEEMKKVAQAHLEVIQKLS
ncbi:Panacea domain-containing protein [Acinetobacter proteolyticus]|uniref:Panacea domain-containing protein n=1 Tax=Acinetobacter proteolyticus TaxID=1776741 RepID=UPI003D96DFB1